MSFILNRHWTEMEKKKPLNDLNPADLQMEWQKREIFLCVCVCEIKRKIRCEKRGNIPQW